MSSPHTLPNFGYPDRATASSPGFDPRRAAVPQGSEDVSVRQMRLKVLYTFDDQNKTNCLARWPQALDIRTASLDESLQIGVIELKTCIQAIVSASPELVAKLGQDYTVYAYDYSEYETPLVGQGMLSWILASPSATPSAPAHLPRTMVTGRVCKNIMGIFSSNLQETLEVKLRLVPVPTCLQSEYLESLTKYRDLSKIVPLGFDPGTWTSFLQANSAIGQLTSQSRCQSPAIRPGQNNETGLGHVQRVLGEGSSNSYLEKQPPQPQGGNFQIIEANGQLPRASSPAMSVQSATAPPKRRGRPPRNASKTSNQARDTQPKNLMSRDSLEISLPPNDDRFEDGPAKKRAKVSKADWNGAVGLGKQPESLRVAASTAASVRIIHQPTVLRPSANVNISLEGPPRAPTPVADPTHHVRRPPLPTAKSNLRRESYTVETVSYESPYHASDALPKPPDSVMTSPENSRTGSSSHTPVDIASSPPIYRGASTAPTSPNLPALPQNVDSRFVSESIDDLFEGDESRPLEDEDNEVASQYSRHPDSSLAVQESDTTHQSVIVDSAPQSQNASEATDMACTRTVARSSSGFRVLDRTASSGDLASHFPINNEPAPRGTLNRAQTWSGHQAQQPAPDTVPFPQGSGPSENPSSKCRAGKGANAKRKKAIQSKLELSVAAGEIPPFCENCGAIETPTWRRAWVKVHSGTPEHVKISEEEGGIVAWQALKTDSEGNVYLYRIVKKSVLPLDEGFTEILLCNREWPYLTGKKVTNDNTACGLWLTTRKCMRPREWWEKNQRDPDEKRKRASRPKKSKETNSDTASMDAPRETNEVPDHSPPPNDTEPGGNVDEVDPLPRTNRQRALSEQLNSNDKKDLSAAIVLQKATRSSPARFIGTQRVPIDIEDLTPKPTRRILFPSPKQAGDRKSLPGNGANAGNEGNENSPIAIDPALEEDDSQADKENRPPSDEDKFPDEFVEDVHSVAARPITPPSSSQLISKIFQTPRKPATPERNFPTTGDFFSSAAKALLLPTTPKRTPGKSNSQPLSEMTPFTAHLSQLLSESNNMSPSGHNFDFPSLPSLRNTPSGRMRDEFDFPEFDTQNLLSTDGAMPSSPPAWFGVYEDPVEEGSALWSDYQFPGNSGADEDESARTGH
ncbi:hypothetical protein MMC07_000540 [Pseudocyphellaria aurata]|nr:hypothetical protein [Pseudocyphellaria aurata]